MCLILNCLQESSLYEDCIPLTEHQAIVTADLVEGLIGSPPTLNNLTTGRLFLQFPVHR